MNEKSHTEEQNKIAEMAPDISRNTAAAMFYWMKNGEIYSELYDQYGCQLGGFVEYPMPCCKSFYNSYSGSSELHSER
jgi:hypothetical protein